MGVRIDADEGTIIHFETGYFGPKADKNVVCLSLVYTSIAAYLAVMVCVFVRKEYVDTIHTYVVYPTQYHPRTTT